MLPEAWQKQIFSCFDQAEFHSLMQRAETAYREKTVFPPRQNLFAAFRLTQPWQVRAVILGQDPYHEQGQAHGLAFSVEEGVKLPPSLRNIYKELESDLGVTAPQSGDLRFWAEQGVLLLNTVLTVEEGKAGGHSAMGWQSFTDAVVESLADLPQPIAFVLWGAHAAKKAAVAEQSPHPRLVLTGPHPSPLSAYRGFFGSRPFSQVNKFLSENGGNPIIWAK